MFVSMKENIEIWRPVIGYENYEISSLGRIRNVITGKVLKPLKGKNGYLHIDLKSKHCYIHRLVAEAFIPNPDNLPLINHKDENPLNNCVDNLEWCTHKYNINYGTAIQRRIKTQLNSSIFSKPVGQYSLDGTLIKVYPSQCEAVRQTGFSQGNIWSCCLGKRKTHKGYIWRYV